MSGTETNPMRIRGAADFAPRFDTLPEPEHSKLEGALHIGHVAIDAAELVQTALHAAGAGAHTVSHFAARALPLVGWILTAKDVVAGVVDLMTAGAQGYARGLLECAMRSEEPGRRWAAVALLSGMSEAEMQALRNPMNPADRRAFDSQRANLEDNLRSSASARAGLDRAREDFVLHMRNFEDGVASTIEGWSDAERGPMFEAGHRFGEHLMSTSPALRVMLQTTARASKHEGFEDARRGAVDEQRHRSDPHYRSGVAYFRRVSRNTMLEAHARQALNMAGAVAPRAFARREER